MGRGRIVYKRGITMARKAKRGERVVTIIDKRVTSDIVIDTDTHMVIQGPVYQELYALSKASFEGQYEDRASHAVSTESARVEQAKEKLLATQGFQAYSP